jgi:hypothetical protein
MCIPSLANGDGPMTTIIDDLGCIAALAALAGVAYWLLVLA